MSIPSLRHLASLVAVACILTLAELSTVARANPPVGFLETWSGTSVQGWGGGSSFSNPGTGGVGGATDGFLLVSNPSIGQLGVRSNGAPYVGNWKLAGVDLVRFAVKDVGANDDLELHFGIGNGTNFWQSNAPILPSDTSWTVVTIPLIQSNFTQIIGSASFDAALQSVDRLLVRHDKSPYVKQPDAIKADFGLDNLLLANSQTPNRPISWGQIKARYADERATRAIP